MNIVHQIGRAARGFWKVWTAPDPFNRPDIGYRSGMSGPGGDFIITERAGGKVEVDRIAGPFTARGGIVPIRHPFVDSTYRDHRCD